MFAVPTLLIQESGTYIVRWPPWVGAIIALTLGATIGSAGSEALRRRFGLQKMWIVVGVACLVLVLLLVPDILRDVPTHERPSAFLAIVAGLLAMFLAPSYGIWRGSRTQPTSYGAQIGRGVLAAFGFAFLAVVGLSLVVVVSRLGK
jgi:hypothetical protein